MSADDIADMFVLPATVEQFLGTSGYGVDLFGPAVTLDPAADNGCFIDDARQLVRSATGEQVVSESTLYTHPANAVLFTVGARVTVNGQVSRVIKTKNHVSGDLDLPDNLEVTLT